MVSEIPLLLIMFTANYKVIIPPELSIKDKL